MGIAIGRSPGMRELRSRMGMASSRVKREETNRLLAGEFVFAHRQNDIKKRGKKLWTINLT